MPKSAKKKSKNIGGVRPGAGRKPIGRQRTIVIPDDLWQAVSEAAARQGINKPQFVRDALRSALGLAPDDRP